ncbi:MAG: roadblock/LC7 domain-containing protein [Candidatus Lokiarchaeota archaeon]
MASRLELVLKELNDNAGFLASLFSTSTGLVLASQKSEKVDERVVAAMSSLLSDSANKAREELNLSELESIKIKFTDDIIIMKNILIEDNTKFILAVLGKAPDSDDIEKYYDELLDWAVENSLPDLKKLSSI